MTVVQAYAKSISPSLETNECHSCSQYQDESQANTRLNFVLEEIIVRVFCVDYHVGEVGVGNQLAPNNACLLI